MGYIANAPLTALEHADVYECTMLNPSTGAAADMSTAKLVGPWLPCEKKEVSAEFSWPSTGTPVGTPGLEFTNKPDPEVSDDGVAYGSDNYPTTPEGPDGSAGSTICGPVERQAAYVRPVCTRTSGGAGATLTCRVALF